MEARLYGQQREPVDKGLTPVRNDTAAGVPLHAVYDSVIEVTFYKS